MFDLPLIMYRTNQVPGFLPDNNWGVLGSITNYGNKAKFDFGKSQPLWTHVLVYKLGESI